MDIDKLAAQETASRQQSSETIQKQNYEAMRGVHSTPILPKEPAQIKAQQAQQEADIKARREMPLPQPLEQVVDTPPSLYKDIHGKTIVAEHFSTLDTAHSVMLHEYILGKMNVGNLEDTRENYEKVLHTLMSKNKVNENQKSDYILQRLYLYLTSGRDPEDDLVMTVLTKRGVKLYARK